VAAGVEAHAENGIAGLDQRLKYRAVGLGAGVRLDVGVGGAKQLFGVVDRQAFGDVDKLAAA